MNADPIIDKLGRPVRDLRISVIDKCNFRCPYCMPAEIFGADYNFLTNEELLRDEEIVRLARRGTPSALALWPEAKHVSSERP